MPNTDGRVSDGVYTAGWLGTGPRGVIIDTMNNAFKVTFYFFVNHLVYSCHYIIIHTILEWKNNLNNKCQVIT